MEWKFMVYTKSYQWFSYNLGDYFFLRFGLKPYAF